MSATPGTILWRAAVLALAMSTGLHGQTRPPQPARSPASGTLGTADVAASEQLLYAVSSGTGDRLPRPTTTDVFAFDLESGASRRVFSDANQSFVLVLPFRGGVPEIRMAAAANRIFGYGRPRSQTEAPPGQEVGAFYELSSDGSNRSRQVCAVQGQQAPRNVFVSPSGGELGYVNHVDAKWFVFIHDTGTGALLHRIALEPILLDGFVRSIGWMPDGRRIFVTAETGDEHVTSEESYIRVGTYIMNADGSGILPLAASVDSASSREGFFGEPDTPPTMLGSMPDGRYVFADLQFGSRESRTFYYLVDPATGEREDITPDREGSGRGGFLWSKLAPDGKYLAFSELEAQGRQERVRVLDIRSGETRAVLSHPIRPLSYPVLTVVGWRAEPSTP